MCFPRMGWVARPLWMGSAWHINLRISGKWTLVKGLPASISLLGTWAVGTVPAQAAPKGHHEGRAPGLLGPRMLD